MHQLHLTNSRSLWTTNQKLFAFKVSLIGGIALSFLLANLAFARYQPSIHHHQHDKDTHSQSWCSWSCQAGQAASVNHFHLEVSEKLLNILSPTVPLFRIVLLKDLPSPRGPPPFHTSP